MNQKAAYAFRIILSGYLAYLGVKILLEMSTEKPSNMIFMIVIGAAFLVIGAGYAVYCIKKVWDIRQSEKELQTNDANTEQNYSTNLCGKAEQEKSKSETKKTGDSEVKEDIENDYEEK